MNSAFVKRLAPHRFHAQHGPIDCVVEILSDAHECDSAFAALQTFFPTILPALIGEKQLLYCDLRSFKEKPTSFVPTAQMMIDACWPFREQFITPMAAVAGSVADTLLQALRNAAPNATKIWVNNGGDIAFHVSEDETFSLGLVDDPQHPTIGGTLLLSAQDATRGVATSGWRGRSFSFGIADAVTVLATSAAQADAAATMIANAVNAEHPAIHRVPANTVKDETDLGAQLVTRHVGALDEATVQRALDAGEAFATRLCTYEAISAAALRLQGRVRVAPANHRAFALSAI